MDLLKLNEAADVLGISFPTIKQWIYKGKIRSVKTAGGHHRIPQDEIDRILGTKNKVRRSLPHGLSLHRDIVSAKVILKLGLGRNLKDVTYRNTESVSLESPSITVSV